MRCAHVLTAVLLAAFAAVSSAESVHWQGKVIKEVVEVVNATELSQEQKVAKLKQLVANQQMRLAALYQLDRLDPPAAMETAAGLFRARDSSREAKLQMGHFLLTAKRPGKPGFPPGFIKEYATWLIADILENGQADFCVKLPGHPLTAVGEYACLASDFDGFDKVDFGPFTDPRVIDVLIACLDAPDNVYAADQGDHIRGKPGESTGRNIARQQIPVALARLNAAKAVEPLRRLLKEHHDWYERDNAACALAMLEPPADHAALIARLKGAKALNAQGKMDQEKDRFYHLYAFGRGLLRRGDDSGIEFMAFPYSIYDSFDGLSENCYMLEQRLEDLKDIKSPKLEGFFKQAFASERVKALFLHDKTRIKVVDDGPVSYNWERAAPRIEQLFDKTCRIIEENHLAGLRPTVEQFARDSASEPIRARAQRCADGLNK